MADSASALAARRRTLRSAGLGTVIALAAMGASLALAIAISALIFGSDGGLA